MRYIKYFLVVIILLCVLYICYRQQSIGVAERSSTSEVLSEKEENNNDTEQSSTDETLPESEMKARVYSPCEIEGDSWFVELSPPDKTLFELATKIYSDSELEEIVNLKGRLRNLMNSIRWNA